MKKIAFAGLLSLLGLVSSLLLGEKNQKTDASRVIAVSLWAENVPQAAEFYQDLLGLQEHPVAQNGRMRLRLDGSVLFILKGKPCSAVSDSPFPLFALAVNDLDRAEAFLKTRNITMPYGIEGSGLHREMQFYDPAGNLVELVQNR